jgi:hypothetical protein
MNLIAHEIEGDDTGRVTLRRTQTYENTEDRVLQTIGVLSQRDSSVNLPPELDCRGIDMYIKGKPCVTDHRCTVTERIQCEPAS